MQAATDSKAYVSLAGEAGPSEPQNPLTRRFTPAEWDAFKKLRPMLPEVRRIAFGGDTPKTFSIWGITIDPTDPASDARVSVVLMRFLRARKLDVDATKTLLIELLRWRQEINIDEVVNREFPQWEHYAVTFGKDKAGRPVIYNQMNPEKLRRFWSELEQDSKTVILRTARNLERIARSLNYETVEQTTHVTDLGSMSLEQLGEQRRPNAALTRVVQSYYPNFTAQRFLINTPFWATMLARGLTFFGIVPEVGIVYVGKGTENISKRLREFIDVKELPKQLGGEADGFSWHKEPKVTEARSTQALPSGSAKPLEKA